jgi:hypothetical protein
MTEQTSADIEQQINAVKSATQPPNGQVVTVVAPVSTGQAEVPIQVPAQTSADVVSTPAQVEQKTAEQVTAETIAKEQTSSSPTEIERSYAELRKKFTQTAMENAKLRAQTAQPQPINAEPTPAPAANMDEINRRFVEDLSRNPIETLAKVVKALNQEDLKPFAETQKQAKLNEEIIRLSTSADTAQTFNLKQVQDEIKKVIEENPNYLDNLPQNLATAHDIALGRLARRGFQVNVPQTVISQSPVPVEGRNKSLPATVIDPKGMTAAQLEAQINALTSNR